MARKLRKTRVRAYEILQDGGNKHTLMRELGLCERQARIYARDFRVLEAQRDGSEPLPPRRSPTVEALVRHGWRLPERDFAASLAWAAALDAAMERGPSALRSTPFATARQRCTSLPAHLRELVLRIISNH